MNELFLNWKLNFKTKQGKTKQIVNEENVFKREELIHGL